MPKTLRFEGYSDDTFGEYGATRVDHDNCANGKPIAFKVWSAAEGRGLYVVGHYGQRSGGWMVGVEPVDNANFETEPLPQWPILIVPSAVTPYSPSLQIEAPDDATVTLEEP